MTTIYMGKTASAFSQVPFKSGLEEAFCTYAVCMHAFLTFVICTLHLYICFRVAHTWTRCTKQYSFSNKKFLTPKDAQLEILRNLLVKPYKKAAFPCPETTGSTERYLVALCSTFSNSKRFLTKWVFASSALFRTQVSQSSATRLNAITCGLTTNDQNWNMHVLIPTRKWLRDLKQTLGYCLCIWASTILTYAQRRKGIQGGSQSTLLLVWTETKRKQTCCFQKLEERWIKKKN